MTSRAAKLFSGPYALVAVAAVIASLNVMGAFGSDEVWSLHTITKSFSDMSSELRGDVHPPLYYWFLFVWVRIAGQSEFAMRSLSGLFYLASISALYRFGRELGGATIGTLAAAVYLTSPLAILAAHLARMYSLLSLISILSTWLYWRIFVEGRAKRTEIVLFAAINALGTLTHIWFFFVLFAEGVHWLAMRRSQFVKFTAVMTASLLPYAFLWLPVLLRQVGKSDEAAAWIPPPNFAEVGIVAFVYSGVLLLLLPPFLFQAIRRRLMPLAWAGAFALMLVTALATPFALSFIKPLFYSRFTIIGLHFFALVVAASLGRVANWQLSTAACAIALGCSIYVAAKSNPCDARGTAQYLATHATATDAAIFNSLSRMPIDHYLHQLPNVPKFDETSFPSSIDTHPGYEGALLAPGRDAKLREEAEALATSLRQRHGRVFFFQGFRPQVDAVMESALDRQLKRVDQVRCSGMPCYYNSITVYEPPQ